MTLALLIYSVLIFVLIIISYITYIYRKYIALKKLNNIVYNLYKEFNKYFNTTHSEEIMKLIINDAINTSKDVQ